MINEFIVMFCEQVFYFILSFQQINGVANYQLIIHELNITHSSFCNSQINI